MKEVNIIKTRKFLLLTLLILLLFPIDSKAVHSNLSYAERIGVVPLWDNVIRLNVNISNSSNIVNCLLNIRSKENQNIIGTMYLEKFDNQNKKYQGKTTTLCYNDSGYRNYINTVVHTWTGDAVN